MKTRVATLMELLELANMPERKIMAMDLEEIRNYCAQFTNFGFSPKRCAQLRLFECELTDANKRGDETEILNVSNKIKVFFMKEKKK